MKKIKPFRDISVDINSSRIFMNLIILQATH